MIGDVVVQPVINLVDLPVDAFQQLEVRVVVTVVLSTHPFNEDGEDAARCEDRQQDSQRLIVHDATACTSTRMSHPANVYTLIVPSPLTGTHDVLQIVCRVS